MGPRIARTRWERLRAGRLAHSLSNLLVIAVMQLFMSVVYFVNQFVCGKSHCDSEDADDHQGYHNFQSPLSDPSNVDMLKL